MPPIPSQPNKPPYPTNHKLWHFPHPHWNSRKTLLYSPKVLKMNLS